jgi:hypothetical protein
MNKPIILDLCGGTGSWSKPYIDAGYDVRIVTLPDNNVIDYIPPDNIFGILAAPPCDQFSIARNRHENNPNVPPRDIISAMNPVNACIRIIFQCQDTLKFWALENPVGSLIRKYLKMKPTYRFEPWWFDEPWSKRTYLWGNFKIPERKYLNYYDNPKALTVKILAKRRYTARKDGIPSIADITSGSEKEKRAITPSGFAKAFFEANNVNTLNGGERANSSNIR